MGVRVALAEPLDTVRARIAEILTALGHEVTETAPADVALVCDASIRDDWAETVLPWVDGTRGVPVVLMTAGAKAALDGAGVVGELARPFGMRELASTLARLGLHAAEDGTGWIVTESVAQETTDLTELPSDGARADERNDSEDASEAVILEAPATRAADEHEDAPADEAQIGLLASRISLRVVQWASISDPAAREASIREFLRDLS